MCGTPSPASYPVQCPRRRAIFEVVKNVALFWLAWMESRIRRLSCVGGALKGEMCFHHLTLTYLGTPKLLYYQRRLLNGVSLNDVSLNDVSLNGVSLNDISLNGVSRTTSP